MPYLSGVSTEIPTASKWGRQANDEYSKHNKNILTIRMHTNVSRINLSRKFEYILDSLAHCLSYKNLSLRFSTCNITVVLNLYEPFKKASGVYLKSIPVA